MAPGLREQIARLQRVDWIYLQCLDHNRHLSYIVLSNSALYCCSSRRCDLFQMTWDSKVWTIFRNFTDDFLAYRQISNKNNYHILGLHVTFVACSKFQKFVDFESERHESSCASFTKNVTTIIIKLKFFPRKWSIKLWLCLIQLR